MGLFRKKEKQLHKEIDIQKEIRKAEKEDESLWIKCSSCKELLYRKEVERNLDVCPKCSYHFPISVEKRVALTFDRGTFAELYTTVEPIDFLKFKDTKSYKVRLTELKEATKKTNAVFCGRGKIEGLDVLCAIFDFSFMGGSLGSVEGEKITRLLEEGKTDKLPVIIFCASGGARMQEGIVSLMQMAKVSGAIYRLKCERIPYLTVLTDATLGGVTASMAMLGDIIIGEPKAMIGFAGQRVIKETIKEDLPPGFQRAEYLLEHGMIDIICSRREIKQKLHNILCRGMKGYSDTLDYLYGLEQFGIVFGLESINRILSLIGNPQNRLRAVHIAGTNGKGSVASMVAMMARQAGYRTGLYTSPHLISFTERITVNGELITEKEVVDLTRLIRERIEEDGGDLRFTFFDFTTALAFEYFRRKEIDLAVIEVGLGGRLDSTNVLVPLVSVITNIALDHQDYLGNNIEAIAREKAGIIKKGVPTVTGARDTALDVIKDTADREDLYVLGESFNYCRKSDQHMSYQGMGTTLDDLSVALRGDHQLFNAALALCVIELLRRQGFVIEEGAVRGGLGSVDWPGRLEIISGGGEKPAIILDGAHNPEGTRTLAAFLRTHFRRGKRILVFGVMKDKNFPDMLSTLLPTVDRVILTRPNIDRAAHPADVAAYAPGAVITGSVQEAIGEALKIARPRDTIVVAGSFYTIGEAKKLLDEKA